MNDMTVSRSGKKIVRLPIPRAGGYRAEGAPVPAAGLPGGPSMADVTKNIDAIARAFEEFKAENDRRLAEIAKSGSADVVTGEKVDRINNAIGDMDRNMRAMSEQLKLATAMGTGVAEARNGMTREQAAYCDKFLAWARGKEDVTEKDLRAAAMVPNTFRNGAMHTGSDPDGGFLLPEPVVGAMTRVLEVVSAMRTLADSITVSSGSGYTKPHNLGGATSGWVGERGTRSNTDGPTISELKFPVFEIYAQPLATQTLLDDVATDFEGWLGGEVAIGFAEKEGDAFIEGEGDTKPMGFLSYTKVANASYAWGKIGYVVSGVASALSDATNNGGDALISHYHSLKQGYRASAQWLMSDATMATVRKLKDSDGNYLWQPGLTLDAPATLLGKPIAIDDNMPAISSNTYPIAFGDWKRGYLIVDRIGIRTLRDPYTSKPYVKFYTTKRVGGGVQDFAAIKLLKIST